MLPERGEEVQLHHKGVLGIDGHTIYYVGGFYAASSTGFPFFSLANVNMNHIRTYNTISAVWGNIEANGPEPRGRVDHTLTMSTYI